MAINTEHPVGNVTARSLSKGRGSHGDFVKAMVLMSLAVITPTTVFYLFSASSQALGVAMGAAVIALLAAIGVMRNPSPGQWARAVFVIGCIGGAVMLHALVASFFEPVDFGRAVSSSAIFAVLGLGAFALSHTLFGLDNGAISRTVSIFLVLMIIIGAFGVAGIHPPGGGIYFKPVFPFTEPSHFALTMTPILLAFCVNKTLTMRVVGLVAVMLLAYLLQSLSLVVGVLMVAVVVLPTPWIVAGAVALVALVGILDIDYFTDRLDLSVHSGNLSALVYIQGWDLAGESLRRTSWWGIGFQQLGIGSITTYTSSLIVSLAGTDSNLRDGGFTLAKVLAEFGVLGAGVAAAYTAVLVRCGWRLRQIALRKRSAAAGTILAMAFVCGYAIEAFVRGIGYFSGTMLLLVAALIFLGTFRRRIWQ